MSRNLLLAALLLGAVPIQAQQARQRPLRVVRVQPAPNALAVSAATTVAVEFNVPIDLASAGPLDFQVVGRWSGPCPGTFSVGSQGRVLRFTPTRPFSAGELVTVSLSNAFRAPFHSRIGRGVVWSFWVESRAGSRSFTRVTTLPAGSIPYGAYGGDIDQDGDLDLCIPNEGSADVTVYLSNGAGFDPPSSYAVGRRASANEAADLDLDGNLDLVVANVDDDDLSVLRGVGDGTFRAQTRHAVGVAPRGLAVFDVNGDGDADILSANRGSSDLSLIRNLGNGTLKPESRLAGGVMGETSLAVADMNRDGVLDLVVVGFDDGNARTLLGDGRGAFTPRMATAIGAGPWTVVAGDVDADGSNDIAASLANASSAVVALNVGSGVFAAPTVYATGFFPTAVDLGDLDGDGLLDMTATSFSGATYHVWFNQGGGVMGNTLTLPATLAGSCTVLHDLDGDGDLDITGIDEAADEVHVYLQDG